MSKIWSSKKVRRVFNKSGHRSLYHPQYRAKATRGGRRSARLVRRS